MFINAVRNGNEWQLSDRWGHELRLPALPADSTAPVRIGTLGTKFEAPASKRIGNKTTVVARMLQSLEQPVFVLDTRRNGCGAQSSWSPLEFATLIPAQISNGQPFGFIHLPAVAPLPSLLASEKRGELGGWRQFRERYNAELGDAAVAVARAFVEAAAVRSGLAVLLCAEPYQPDFTALTEHAQDKCHCHRFNLARRVADAIKADRPGPAVERVDLDAAAFVSAFPQGRGYEPLVRRL